MYILLLSILRIMTANKVTNEGLFLNIECESQAGAKSIARKSTGHKDVEVPICNSIHSSDRLRVQTDPPCSQYNCNHILTYFGTFKSLPLQAEHHSRHGAEPHFP